MQKPLKTSFSLSKLWNGSYLFLFLQSEHGSLPLLSSSHLSTCHDKSTIVRSNSTRNPVYTRSTMVQPSPASGLMSEWQRKSREPKGARRERPGGGATEEERSHDPAADPAADAAAHAAAAAAAGAFNTDLDKAQNRFGQVLVLVLFQNYQNPKQESM
uniref:Uncharacterized protein n=1 Tax=Knipowitschia caucasica TaxID=637954 RepID=A0AAV2LTC1_KNICA